MIIIRLWRYLCGYLLVRCEGGFFNRFFDKAMGSGLSVFNIKVTGSTARFFIRAADYHSLRKIAKKSGCRVRVAGKHGLYFDYKKLNNKTALVAGLLVFCMVIYLFGSMVFTIRIEGSSTIPKTEIIESLQRNGLRVGMLRSDVDVTAVEHGVMLDNARLSWIAVNLSFGVATVELRDKTPDPIEAGTYRQITAKCDAQIKEITLVSGTALVKEGDVVLRGQVLVEPSGLTPRGSWAEGVQAKIVAYTQYTFRFSLDKHHVFRTQTGNTITNKVLRVGDAVIPLSFLRNTFTYFDVITYETPISLFSVELPARMYVEEYIEIQQTSRVINAQEAYVILGQYQTEYEKTTLKGCEIMNRREQITDAGAWYEYTVQYLCLEDICVYE